MNDQNKDDQTTRIAAAVLLKCYCATQDGFIVELCSLMTAMLKENINLSLNNSLPLLVFYILHELLRDRPDLTVQLAHTIA